MLPLINEIPENEILKIRLILFDFDGVFTNNYVIVDENGVEAVQCSRSDGIGLSLIKSIGIKTRVVSTEKNPVVSKRCQKLGIECSQGVDDKGKEIQNLANMLKVNLNEIMFVGNDINDKPAFDIVGLPIGVRDSHSSIYSSIKYTTKNCGGNGCVREICDLFISMYEGKKNDVD